MKKNVLLIVFVSLVALFFEANLFAQAPPTVTSPIYYCQGSTASPLTATASAGYSLLWYGTNATGGTGSTTAPTPLTTSVGSTTYYVSQTDGTNQSARASIVVNVVADNGSSILSFRCDETQITAPSTRYNAVFFDWTNTTGLPNQYTYSYSVDGSPAITGTTGPTNLQVSGLTQGQSVTLTVWHTTYPCDRSVLTCTVPCLTFSTPTFDPIGPICAGDTPPNLPTTSKEGIDGSWSPSLIDNTATRTYVFTPNANECARTQNMTVTVNPDSPGFSSFDICSGSSVPALSNTSPTGVTGTWNPAAVDNMNSDSYTFTPNPGQCAAPRPRGRHQEGHRGSHEVDRPR